MAGEIAYQIATEGGMSHTLKELKNAIWPTFPVKCEEFSLHDLGHALKEVDNMLSLQLPKFPGWQYDPFGTVKNFTTMVKIKVFTNEEDAFDDIFLQKNTFAEVKHMPQLLLDHEDLEKFYSYRERMLTMVPLDQLLIEPIREPTPSMTIEGNSKENSKSNSGAESQEKSIGES